MEYDIVILINTKTGEYGFPSQIADDDVLNMLLSQADRYPQGEERRLFYVAMTRAKEKAIFLVEEDKKSQFIHDIEIKEEEDRNDKYEKCPECKNQDLRKIKDWKCGTNLYCVIGCKNYLYGCEYYRKKLLADGILIENNDEYYFNVGKHKGQKIEDVPDDYIRYFLRKGDITEKTKTILRKTIEKKTEF